ncbi:MAG: hypothetical protein ACOYIE_03245 [Agathobaculum sp.]
MVCKGTEERKTDGRMLLTDEEIKLAERRMLTVFAGRIAGMLRA